MDQARTDLTGVSDDLAQLYHMVCNANGETPQLYQESSSGKYIYIKWIFKFIRFSNYIFLSRDYDIIIKFIFFK